MFIRYLAVQVYQTIKKIEELEKRLAQCGPDEQDSIRTELETTRKERNRLKKILDAKKADPAI
jgi:hypothetical protein